MYVDFFLVLQFIITLLLFAQTLTFHIYEVYVKKF